MLTPACVERDTHEIPDGRAKVYIEAARYSFAMDWHWSALRGSLIVRRCRLVPRWFGRRVKLCGKEGR